MRRLLFGGIAFCVAVAGVLARPTPPRPSDYDAELVRIEAIPDRLQRLYLRASLTADYRDFKRVEEALGDNLLVRAHLAFKLHRLPETKRCLALLPDSEAARGLQADMAFMEGRYDDAARLMNALPRTWDNLSRLANLEAQTGHPDRADALYTEAEEELTAKELRSYAWVELQRGIIRFEHGEHAKALAHYQRADRAYSGWWLVEEHMAEVLEAMGEKRKAIAMYRQVLEKTRNPEYVAALASLTKDEALYAEADRLYAEQLRLYPEAAIGHALRTKLKRGASPELVTLAKQNVGYRPNAESKLLLAEAYLKTNQIAQARALVDEIARTPWRTPELARVQGELQR
jgi:tetratricopeptide (TPR) repeat protein